MAVHDVIWAAAAAFAAGVGTGLWRAIGWAIRRAMVESIDQEVRPRLDAIEARIDAQHLTLEIVQAQLQELRRLVIRNGGSHDPH